MHAPCLFIVARRSQHRQPFSIAAIGIDKQPDLLRRPTRRMAMPHVDLDAHLLWTRHDVKTFLVAVKRVMDIVSTIDEQNWNAATWQQARRIISLDPSLT